MRLKKFLIFSFIIINFVSFNQSYSMEPDVFVQSTVNRASEALDNKYSKEEKIEKLKQIAIETVDINGIVYYTLGSYRKNISENEIREYETLFRQYFFYKSPMCKNQFHLYQQFQLLSVLAFLSSLLLNIYYLKLLKLYLLLIEQIHRAPSSRID